MCSSRISFYRNIGSEKAPDYDNPIEILSRGDGFARAGSNRIFITDWNNDGKYDVLIGDQYFVKDEKRQGGNIWLYLGK